MRRGFLIGVVMALASGLLAAQPPQRRPLWPPPNPTVLDRLERMSPEERRRALEKLPPERRQRIEERLRQYESLTPEERERLRRQFEQFRQMPPERQQALRELYQRFRELPEDRRRAVRRGVWELQRLGEARRQFRLSRPWFQNRYSPEELEMVRELLEVATAPEGGGTVTPPG
jgi:hypothetical protein